MKCSGRFCIKGTINTKKKILLLSLKNMFKWAKKL